MSVYTGLDPVTGKRLYLTDSTTDEAEARRILILTGQVECVMTHAVRRGVLSGWEAEKLLARLGLVVDQAIGPPRLDRRVIVPIRS